ncbi:hypothetical protein GIB67_017296 [Kingdonia uniflora]|uniref:3-hydroxyacyl-CoA dehydrogenase n=1 Tax=Kingdonia uniflora TaxID=39325 RepID=A0A7J7N426_9MAGN|nr:hypothetical protein GIB67_017296 [Kingdonia uniflora]
MTMISVTMEVGSDGVAVITFSNPPFNALSPTIVAGLKEKYLDTMQRDDVKAIVLTGDAGKFSSGFDINVFQTVHKNGDTSALPDVSVDLVLNTIEDAKKPTVAAIEGLAFGGGLELAMVYPLDVLHVLPHQKLNLAYLSCHLGLFLEWEVLFLSISLDGTQRLPRLVGVSNAVEMMMEKKVSKELILSSTAKALVHIFFAQRATSKVPSVTDVGLKPRHIKKVAIIGGGLMGCGIATTLILSNISVVLKEINTEYLQKGVKMIEETYNRTLRAANLQGLVAKRKLTQDKLEKAFSLLKGVLDYSEFNHVDMVVEAVIENIQLKQSIFREIEKVCPPRCILATNTSTIDLNIVGENTNSEDRILGAHFFSPAHVMPLLEIVRTEKTSAQVILDLMTVGKTIKKVPVVVGNCTGFAVNRTFFPYTQGSHLLANLGVDVFRIDRVIRDFGMPMGPFQLEDIAGYGVAMAAGKEFATIFPNRTFKSPLVGLLMKDGRHGKINGKGYYVYQKGSKPNPDPTVQTIIQESIRITKIMPHRKGISLSDQEIMEMVLFPVVNEACRVMEEGVVVRASDLDIASVLGMSFPSYRGGIVFWADAIGSSYIYTSLKKWFEAYGSFYKPLKFLEERATKGMPLSAPVSTSTFSRPRL